MKSSLRICENGHKYYKSSDCSVCPECENLRKPEMGFLSILVAPARRALENAGIHSLEQLSGWSEQEILRVHGLGKSSIPLLKRELEKVGLDFK